MQQGVQVQHYSQLTETQSVCFFLIPQATCSSPSNSAAYFLKNSNILPTLCRKNVKSFAIFAIASCRGSSDPYRVSVTGNDVRNDSDVFNSLNNTTILKLMFRKLLVTTQTKNKVLLFRTKKKQTWFITSRSCDS